MGRSSGLSTCLREENALGNVTFLYRGPQASVLTFPSAFLGFTLGQDCYAEGHKWRLGRDTESARKGSEGSPWFPVTSVYFLSYQTVRFLLTEGHAVTQPSPPQPPLGRLTMVFCGIVLYFPPFDLVPYSFKHSWLLELIQLSYAEINSKTFAFSFHTCPAIKPVPQPHSILL